MQSKQRQGVSTDLRRELSHRIQYRDQCSELVPLVYV